MPQTWVIVPREGIESHAQRIDGCGQQVRDNGRVINASWKHLK